MSAITGFTKTVGRIEMFVDSKSARIIEIANAIGFTFKDSRESVPQSFALPNPSPWNEVEILGGLIFSQSEKNVAL